MKRIQLIFMIVGLIINLQTNALAATPIKESVNSLIISAQIHVSTPGKMTSEIVKLGINPTEVTNLTISGNLNAIDFAIIKNNMKKLVKIDLTDLTNNNFLNTLPFKGREGLKSIKLPRNLTEISGSEFQSCGHLYSITLPSSLESIGESAFAGTSFDTIFFGGSFILKNVISTCNESIILIQEGTKAIAPYALLDCSNLTSIILPESVNSIGNSAFLGCKNLKSIDVTPNNITFCSIGGILFDYQMNTLVVFPYGNGSTEYAIPNSVQFISPGAFAGIDYLKKVKLNHNLLSIGSNAFQGCQSLTEISMFNKVSNIGVAAFNACNKLTKVELSSELASIGNLSFAECSSIDTIVTTSIAPPALGANVFKGVNQDNCVLFVPANSLSSFLSTPQWEDFFRISERNECNFPFIKLKTEYSQIKQRLQVFHHDESTIVVEGLTSNEIVQLYNTSGLLINSYKSNTEGTISFEIATKGIYIIKQGDQTVKFAY